MESQRYFILLVSDFYSWDCDLHRNSVSGVKDPLPFDWSQ
jgi:hypothetical protein